MAEETQYFLTQDGQLKAVAPGGLQLAQDSGWRPVGNDLEKARQVRDAGTLGGQVKTAASAAAAGAFDAFTALPRGVAALSGHPVAPEFSGRGLLEQGAYELGGGGLEGAKAAQEFAAAERLRATENPKTAFGASLAGQVAGALPMAGLGGGLSKAIASEAGGGLLARVGGAAAAGAFEGAPLNLVAAQDQAYIENRQLTGEQALAAMGTGALLGAGAAGGAKALGELFSAAVPAVREKAASLFGRGAEAAEGEAAAGEQGMARAASGAEETSAVRKVLRTGDDNINRVIKATTQTEALPEAAEYVRAGVRGENLAEVKAVEQGAAARELRSAVSEMDVATRNLTPEWRELKAENVAKTIAKGEGAIERQAEIAQNQLGEMREKLNEMLADPAAYGDVGTLRKLDRHLTVAEREVSAGFESGKGEDMFVALDDLKKKLGPLAKPGRMLSVAADQESSREVRGLYEGLRQTLTDDAWGKAGEMQKGVNSAFEQWLGTKRLFDQRFMTETGREGWERTFGADPAKIEPYVKGLGASRNDLTQSIIEQHLDNTKKLAQELSKAGELTADKAAELKSIEQSATRFGETLEKVQNKVGAIEQAETVLGKSKEGSGLLGGSVVGHMIGGPIGTAVGFAAGAAANPAKFLTQRLAIEQMASRAESTIGGVLDSFFTGARESATTGAGIAGAAEKVAAATRALPKAARSVGLTSLELFQGKHATPEAAYKARTNEILAANQNYGQQVRDNAGRVFGAVADFDPHSVGAAVNSATLAMQFLQTKLPAPLIDDKSLTPTASRPMPSRMEIQQYADVYAAVTKPLDVIKQIPSGSVTQDQMQAIQQCYPRLYQYIQQEVMGRLIAMDRDGIEVPIRERQILDITLNLNGAGERTFSREFVMKYGPMMRDLPDQPPAQQGPGPQGPSMVATRLKTKTDSFLGE